jgi:Ca2+/Na+ antiporter
MQRSLAQPGSGADRQITSRWPGAPPSIAHGVRRRPLMMTKSPTEASVAAREPVSGGASLLSAPAEPSSSSESDIMLRQQSPAAAAPPAACPALKSTTVLFDYQWSEQHARAMKKMLETFKRDTRSLSEKRREQLTKLSTKALSYVAGVACSAAIIKEIFPSESRICGKGASSDKGCADAEATGFGWRFMFFCVLVAMTCFFFWLLFRLKKVFMRRQKRERHEEETAQARSAALAGADQDVNIDLINAAIAHKLKADFYGSGFEMWSGGWSYSIMLSWSVLLRTVLPLQDFDPWVGAWVYVALMMVFCSGMVYCAHELPPVYAQTRTRKGLSPDRRVRLEFVAKKFSGSMAWLLAIGIISAMEMSFAQLFLSASEVDLAKKISIGDKQRREQLLGEMDVWARWVFCLSLIFISSIILTACSRHKQHQRAKLEAHQLSLQAGLLPHLAPTTTETVWHQRFRTHASDLVLTMIGNLGASSFVKAMTKTLQPCAWMDPVHIPSDAQLSPVGIKEFCPTNITCSVPKQLLTVTRSKACAFDSIDKAANLTSFLQGVEVTAIEPSDKLPLYGKWYWDLLWAVFVTCTMCIVVAKLQARLLTRLEIALQAKGVTGQLLRRRSDFMMTLFDVVSNVAGFIVGKTWSEAATTIFAPSDPSSVFAGHLWWYFAMLLVLSVVGSLLLSMDAKTICRTGSVRGVGSALYQQYQLRSLARLHHSRWTAG